MPKINNKYLVNSMASNTTTEHLSISGAVSSQSLRFSRLSNQRRTTMHDHFSHCTLLKTTKHFIPYIYRTHFNGAFLII